MFTRHQRHESLTCGNSFFSKVVVYAGYQICLLDTKSVLDGYQIFTGYQIRKVDTKQAGCIPNWGQFGILGCHLATLTNTIVWKECGRNNMGNAMQNNLHCGGIKSISKKAINKINANFSECKFTINYVAIKLIKLVISKNSRGPLKTFPRATGWTPLI